MHNCCLNFVIHFYFNFCICKLAYHNSMLIKLEGLWVQLKLGACDHKIFLWIYCCLGKFVYVGIICACISRACKLEVIRVIRFLIYNCIHFSKDYSDIYYNSHWCEAYMGFSRVGSDIIIYARIVAVWKQITELRVKLDTVHI